MALTRALDSLLCILTPRAQEPLVELLRRDGLLLGAHFGDVVDNQQSGAVRANELEGRVGEYLF